MEELDRGLSGRLQRVGRAGFGVIIHWRKRHAEQAGQGEEVLLWGGPWRHHNRDDAAAKRCQLAQINLTHIHTHTREPN